MRDCATTTCVRSTIPPSFVRYYFASENLVLKLFSVLRHIIFLWIKWIMGRCYLYLWWYFVNKIHICSSSKYFALCQNLVNFNLYSSSSWTQASHLQMHVLSWKLIWIFSEYYSLTNRDRKVLGIFNVMQRSYYFFSHRWFCLLLKYNLRIYIPVLVLLFVLKCAV